MRLIAVDKRKRKAELHVFHSTGRLVLQWMQKHVREPSHLPRDQ